MPSIARRPIALVRARSITFLVGTAALAVVAFAAAGCGSSSSSGLPKTAGGQSATLGVADGDLGKILVDSQGRTLYLFQRDTGTRSACTGACAVNWPPLRAAGRPTVGGGASASLAATTARPDGTRQVSYNGHPLYRFKGDQSSGDTNGQGVNAFGGLWYALSSSGNAVTTSPSSGGGYGY